MPKMRLGWYAGASTVLAAGVVVSAFQQRANFYSAMVYLSQSNFCLLVLINFTLIIYGTLVYGLSRLLFGVLRTVEVEQLTERAWFAITETCLAMTIFRDEIGAWFLVMFTALVTGKIWGWIGDGRVEFIEQQPPANPRLFHLRLSASLALSFLYDALILRYTINTVIQQARPNMMVMFLFEFAVLATTSGRTGLRYILSLIEQKIVHSQTQTRLLERRQQIRRDRERMTREREAAVAAGREPESDPLPQEHDIDEMDIEVPGWASKGEWVLWLDLFTDMTKLCIYVTFFFMLLIFYGLPIHIMRDLLMTARDFLKRLNAVLRYRRAIQEMNRYSDATAEELAQENTCIVCREEMRVWDPNTNQDAIDRVRPKKLPCGHILHLGCLKSWLERQQVCPTCRSPVSADQARPQQQQNQNQNQNQNGNENRGFNVNQNQNQNRAGVGLRLQFGGGGQAQFPANQQPMNRVANMPQNNVGAPQQAGQGRDRVFNFGPIRVGFGANFGQQQANIPQVAPEPQQDANHLQQQLSRPERLQSLTNLIGQASALVRQEIQTLNVSQQQLQIIELLMLELQRLDDAGQGNTLDLEHIQRHSLQQQQQLPVNINQPTADPFVLNAQRALREAGFVPAPQNPSQAASQSTPSAQAYVPRTTVPQSPAALAGQQGLPSSQSVLPQAAQMQNTVPQIPAIGTGRVATPRARSPAVLRHGATSYAAAIPSGSPDLPEGVAIPPGWSLMPLQRLEGYQHTHRQSRAPSAGPSNPAAGESQTTTQPNSSTPQASQSNSTVNESSGADAATSSDMSSTNQHCASESPATPSILQDSIPGPASVAAPNPVAPTWGGSSQLFNGNSRPDTLQSTTSSTEHDATEHAGGEASSSPAINATAPQIAERSQKSAGKAVTLEETEDEDA